MTKQLLPNDQLLHFKHRPDQCNAEEIKHCLSAKRIKIILNTFNEHGAINDIKELNHALQPIIDIFTKTSYTNTHLLNDFNHIKYGHHGCEDDVVFIQIYEYFTVDIKIKCDIKHCIHTKRHKAFYNDRANSVKEYNLCNSNWSHAYTLELISRIHAYVVHSYDTHRLTPTEQAFIDEKLEELGLDDGKQIDIDCSDDQKMQIIFDEIKRKKHSVNKPHRDEFSEEKKQKDICINYNDLYFILKDNDINIEIRQLESVFGNYKDVDTFIGDIIDIYHAQNDESIGLFNGICVEKLKCDTEIRKRIYECILYKYFEKHDINNANLIKMAEAIIKKSCPWIDIDEFREKAVDAKVNGKMFIKENTEFMNSLKFAKIFKSINGYKKKQFTMIYVTINSAWTQTNVNKNDIKIHKNTSENDEHKQMEQSEAQNNNEIETEHNEHKTIDENKDSMESEEETALQQYSKHRSEVYEIGIKFHYWEYAKHHKHYIKPNYLHLKEEILDNKLIKFDINRWQRLQNECESDIETDVVRQITSNGYYFPLYKIEQHRPFSKEHLCSLKLYMDYTKESGLFCAILRKGNAVKVTEIAIRARLLSECVQCYGTLIGDKKYYRGVDCAFKFGGIVTRFNLPTSTSVDFNQAVGFSTNGLVLQLRKYKQYDTFRFDCFKLSVYSEEKETLFFGGDTVLQISNIWQHVGKWTSYKQYIVPLNVISRMVHGLTVKRETKINKRNKKEMYELMSHVLYTFNKQKSMKELPSYIDNLLKYYVTNDTITLNFTEIIHNYTWLHPLFIKVSDKKKLLNVSNLCILFRNSDHIIFKMPKDYILTYSECISLIEKDLLSIAANDINIRITFEWPLDTERSDPMPWTNRERINMYQQQLRKINWNRQYSPNTVSFQCIQSSPVYTPAVQQYIESENHKLDESKSPSPPILEKKAINNIKITQNDITLSCILSVKGYISQQFDGLYPSTISQTTQDLISLYYAKPLVMNIAYNGTKDHILYCPVTDTWSSITDKVMLKFEISKNNQKLTSFKYGRIYVDRAQWEEFMWDEDGYFEPTFDHINVFSAWSRSNSLSLKYNRYTSTDSNGIKHNFQTNISTDSPHSPLALDTSYPNRLSMFSHVSNDSILSPRSANSMLSPRSAIDIPMTQVKNTNSLYSPSHSHNELHSITEDPIFDHDSRELTMVDYNSSQYEADIEDNIMPYKYSVSLSTGSYGCNFFYDHSRQSFLNNNQNLTEKYYKAHIIEQLEESIPDKISVDHIIHKLFIDKHNQIHDPYARNIVITNHEDEFCVPDLDVSISDIEKQERDWKSVLYDVCLYHHIECRTSRCQMVDSLQRIHLNETRAWEWRTYLRSRSLPEDKAVKLSLQNKIVDSILGYHHYTIAVSHIIKVYEIFNEEYKLSLAFIINKRHLVSQARFKQDIDVMLEQAGIDFFCQKLDGIQLNETIKTIFRALGEYTQNAKSRNIVLLFAFDVFQNSHQSSACTMYIYDGELVSARYRSGIHFEGIESSILPEITDDHWKLFILEFWYYHKNHVQCYWKIDGKTLRFFPEHMETVWPKYFLMESKDTNRLIYHHKYRHQFGIGLYDKAFCTLYYAATNTRFLSTHYYREYRRESRLSLRNLEINVDEQKLDGDYQQFRQICKNECVINKHERMHECTRVARLVFILKKHEENALEELCHILKRCHIHDLEYIKNDIDHLIKRHFTEFKDVYQQIFRYMVDTLHLPQCRIKLKCWALRRRTRSIHRVETEDNDVKTNVSGTLDGLIHDENEQINALRGILDRLHCDIFHRDPEKHFRHMFVDKCSVGLLQKQTLADFEQIILMNVDKIETLCTQLERSGIFPDELNRVKQYLKVDCLTKTGGFRVDVIRIIEDIRTNNTRNIYQCLNKYSSNFAKHKNIIERYVNNHYLQTAALFREYKIREEIFVNADKKDIKDLLQSEIDIDDESFNTLYDTIRLHQLHQNEEKQSNENEKTLFPLYDADNSDQWVSRPAFKTMKGELLKNSFRAIPRLEYIDTEIECQLLHEDKEKNVDTMSLEEIVALKVFTDYTHLQTAFSMSYYDHNKDNKEKRESEFHHWNIILKQAMHYASRPLHCDQEKRRLWRGLKGLFHFESFEPKAQQPTSFSLKKKNASEFCGDKGILLESSEAIGIPLKWLSNFEHEDEWWCFNTIFKLERIHIKTDNINERIDYLRYSLRNLREPLPHNDINTFQFNDGDIKQYIIELLDFESKEPEILKENEHNGLSLLQTIFFELQQHHILDPIWDSAVDDIETCSSLKRMYILNHKIFPKINKQYDSYTYKEYIMNAMNTDNGLHINISLLQSIAECIQFIKMVMKCIDDYNLNKRNKIKINNEQKEDVVCHFKAHNWNMETFTQNPNEAKAIFINAFKSRTPSYRLYPMIVAESITNKMLSQSDSKYGICFDEFYIELMKYKKTNTSDFVHVLEKLIFPKLEKKSPTRIYQKVIIEYIKRNQLIGKYILQYDANEFTENVASFVDSAIESKMDDIVMNGDKSHNKDNKQSFIDILMKSIDKHQSKYYTKKKKRIYYLDKQQIVEYFINNDYDCARFIAAKKADLIKTIFLNKLKIKMVSAKKLYEIMEKRISDKGIKAANTRKLPMSFKDLYKRIKRWERSKRCQVQSILDYKLRNTDYTVFDLLIGVFELEFSNIGEPVFHMTLNEMQDYLLTEYPPMYTLILNVNDNVLNHQHHLLKLIFQLLLIKMMNLLI